MSATNSTANYELPIFLATDKPAWLTDWNGAMSAIDTAIHTAQAAADGAQTTASAATADISTINASLTTITGNITSLTTSVNSNTGAINTINSLIGNGEPTTTDKTLIGAINEIYGMITGGSNPIEADDVAYDNTTSGLNASNVQAAIDELAGAGAGGVNYSTTEHKVGTWINGEDLYECTINFGALPNSTSKAVATGLTGINKVIEIFGYTSDGVHYDPMPAPSPSAQYAFSLGYNKTENKIEVTTGADFTSFTETYITLRYIKATV